MRKCIAVKSAMGAVAVMFAANVTAIGETPESFVARVAAKTRSSRYQRVCEALKRYPRNEGEKLSFELGEISPLCRPFTNVERKDLDRCGDVKRDPYASYFTWASRNEMTKRGKANLHLDNDMAPQLAWLNRRIGEIRDDASNLCCGDDVACRAGLAKVDVSLCQPRTDPEKPDPCVFGGSFKMSGKGYATVFRAIRAQYQDSGVEAKELRRIADRNLTPSELTAELPPGASNGNIILSSYVSRRAGAASIEPVILHEFGHACAMVRMRNSALEQVTTPEAAQKAVRAALWLDGARKRCHPDAELPQAYFDFWESVGESRGLATCLANLTTLNRRQAIDRGCPGLCPGHYIEESVGIAFSLLLGNVGETAAAVFPTTCDHVRDGQHPMVNDVVECMAQHSPRFRDKIRSAFACK